MAYGAQRVTWAQTATLGGADDPDAFGNRVRRKLRRLGLRHRAAASTSAPVPPAGGRPVNILSAAAAEYPASLAAALTLVAAHSVRRRFRQRTGLAPGASAADAPAAPHSGPR